MTAVAILLPDGDSWPVPKDILSYRPAVSCEVLSGSKPEDFDDAKLAGVIGLLWIPGTKVAALAELFARCPGCKWIHTFSAGVDYVAAFIKGLPEHVQVSNGRGAFSSSLGEYVIAAALHFNKQVPRCLANRAEGRWEKFVIPTLAGKTMGFLGFGSIGQTSARLAKAFGMRIVAVRRNVQAEDEGSRLADVTYSNEEAAQMYAQADFVVCTLPGTAATLDFVNAAAFTAMKSSAVFISLGRGAAVDEDALVAALKAGPTQPDGIAAAALDVFKVEPLPKESPLWACENLWLTAHNADFTDDYIELGWKVWRDNCEAAVAGKPLATPVDKRAGY
tara:strand:+ start:269 stop:1270 length:1002 start_codon:yes stop_codon:yes gene_type:complete